MRILSEHKTVGGFAPCNGTKFRGEIANKALVIVEKSRKINGKNKKFVKDCCRHYTVAWIEAK